MRGFVFSVDALFASVVSITLAMSLFVMLEGMTAQPAKAPLERDLLSALEKTGKLEEIGGGELKELLTKNNLCGSLSFKRDGIVDKEIIACPCNPGGEFYSSSRSVVRNVRGSQDYLVATLRTCLRD
ncbi:MAG: hypothetical protein ABIF01_01980 [Candidatus Micrarchaeota archaeon]